MVEQNIIYVTSQGFYPRLRNSRITAVVQGSNNTTKKIKWLQLNGQPFDLKTSTVTATLRENKDGDVIPVNGTINVTHASNGEIEWTPSETDTGKAGAFFVQFDADFGGGVREVSFPAALHIEPLDTAMAVGSPPLEGITAEQKACLEDLCRLIEITLNDMKIGILNRYDRNVLITTVSRLFTKEVGDPILGAGSGLYGSVERCPVRTNIEIISGITKSLFAFPGDVSAGAFALNTTDFTQNSFAGVVADTAGTTPDRAILTTADGVDIHFATVEKDSIKMEAGGNSGRLNISLGAGGNPLPAFADDAAAGAGGLTRGLIYQTTGTAAAPLNVAGILMIKQ